MGHEMRYNLFYFTYRDDEDTILRLQEELGATVFLAHSAVIGELEYRTLRCENANKCVAYDEQFSFLIRRELLRCIDDGNIAGFISNLAVEPVSDAFVLTGEYWPKDFQPSPVNPNWVVRCYGERRSEHIKQIKEIITIDIREEPCFA